MAIRYLLLIVTFVIAFIPLVYAASFDCSKASTTVERMICADPEVSKLDEALNVKYKAQLLKSDKPDLMRQRQHYWLKARNSCKIIGCIKIYYYQRIAELTEREKELKDLRLKLEIPEYSKDKNPAFCTQLLDSLKRWKNITILTPIVTADSIDNPMLHKYFGKCDPHKFIKSVAIEPRVWNENNLDSLSEDERENYGIPFIMTRGFRLYRTNIDNDPSNHDELILYGAGVRHEWADDSDISVNLTNFNVIDTQRCQISNSAQVEDIVNEENRSFVGLMKFENKNYVFDAKYYYMESLWGVSIQQWTYSPKTKITYFTHVCNYRAKDK
jgi:uncharacterized protein